MGLTDAWQALIGQLQDLWLHPPVDDAVDLIEQDLAIAVRLSTG